MASTRVNVGHLFFFTSTWFYSYVQSLEDNKSDELHLQLENTTFIQ